MIHLNRRMGGSWSSGIGNSSTKIGSLLSLPSIVTDVDPPTEVTPLICPRRSDDLLLCPNGAFIIFYLRRQEYKHAKCQHFSGRTNPG